MGTKLSPGTFDCYAKALPEEPMFVLLARDPAAPVAIRAWAEWRRHAVIAGAAPTSDLAMVDEALRCGIAMISWSLANDGEWRKPRPACHTGAAGNGRIVEVHPDGWTVHERDGVRFKQHLYTGARLGSLGPCPFDPGKAVICVEGGAVDRSGFETDSVMFRISPEGLESMAADMLQAAKEIRANQAINAGAVLS